MMYYSELSAELLRGTRECYDDWVIDREMMIGTIMYITQSSVCYEIGFAFTSMSCFVFVESCNYLISVIFGLIFVSFNFPSHSSIFLQKYELCTQLNEYWRVISEDISDTDRETACMIIYASFFTKPV